MYNLPPQTTLKLIRTVENNQIKEMSQTDYSSWKNEIIKKIRALGLYACTYDCTDKDGQTKTYLCMSAKKTEYENLVSSNFKVFNEWLPNETKRDSCIVNLNKVLIDISEPDVFNKVNFFNKNNFIMRYAQNMSVCKHSFEYVNAEIPDYTTSAACHSLWELNQMRNSVKVPNSSRAQYDEIYKKAAEQYSKNFKKFSLKAKIKEKLNIHKVNSRYFVENFLPVENVSVTGDQLKFLRKSLKSPEYKNFKYHVDFLPYNKLKDLSKKSHNPEDVEVKEYHMTYPTHQKWIFKNIMNDYRTERYKTRTTINNLLNMVNEMYKSRPLQLIVVDGRDLDNWNSLCEANGIEWALEDGSYFGKSYVSENATTYPILYRTDDIPTVNKIVARLTQERSEYNPMKQVKVKREFSEKKFLQQFSTELNKSKIQER